MLLLLLILLMLLFVLPELPEDMWMCLFLLLLWIAGVVVVMGR